MRLLDTVSRCTIALTTAAVMALAACAEAPMPPESSIAVVDQGTQYAVTVPKSTLELLVPKGDLARGKSPREGASASPRYFDLRGQELIVTGWIEPARLHADLDKSLQNEFAHLKAEGFGSPTNMEKLRIGAFDAVLYDLNLPGENTSHVRATWLDAGTWIDLHVSVHTARPSAQARAAVVEAVTALVVRPKQ